jgi:hypothetical protein
MPSPGYFPGFNLVSDPDLKQELDEAGSPPLDHNQDLLPFDSLGGRRFEILAYRLKSVLATEQGRTVTLVQSSADRGRDVLVYERSKLAEIVQCKNQLQKLTRPQVLHELVKLALHSSRDPDVLGNAKVRYEIWCTGDFTEPAALFLDTWPSSWNEQSVKPIFDEVVANYAELIRRILIPL